MNQEAFNFTESKTRADQIRSAFEKFHTENPRVWELFERFTMEVIRAGKQHYSSDAVFQQIRWHCEITTQGEAVKVNDHYRAYYARMFHAKHPEYLGFFRNRILKSKGQPACKPDIQVFIDPEDDE